LAKIKYFDSKVLRKIAGSKREHRVYTGSTEKVKLQVEGLSWRV
jgi:hypothetical protein